MDIVKRKVKSKSKSRKAPKAAATATRTNRPQRMQVDKSPKVHVPHGMSLRARSKKPTLTQTVRKPRTTAKNFHSLANLFGSVGLAAVRQPAPAAEVHAPVLLRQANAPLFAAPRFTFAPAAQQAQAAAQTAVQAAQTAVQAAHVAQNSEMDMLAEGMARLPKINSKGRRRSPATARTLYK